MSSALLRYASDDSTCIVHSFAVSVPKMPAASTPMATNRDLRLSAGLDAGRCAEPGCACMDPLTRPPAFPRLDNDTLFMPVTIFVVATFAAEMLYGALLIGLGLSASPVDAFLYRALPCTLYDCVVGLVLYPIIARLLASGAQDRGPRTPRLR